MRRKRDFDSTAKRKALGIVRPVISPDGKKIAFAALGDIYVMTIGGKPENITKDQLSRHRSRMVARWQSARLFVGQGRRSCCSSGFAICAPAKTRS